RRKQIMNLLLAIKKKIAPIAVAPLPLPSERATGLRKAEKRAQLHNVEHTLDDRARIVHIIHKPHHDHIVEPLGQWIGEKIAEREIAALSDAGDLCMLARDLEHTRREIEPKHVGGALARQRDAVVARSAADVDDALASNRLTPRDRVLITHQHGAAKHPVDDT